MLIYSGIFMALQEKVISCGPSLTLFGLVLKFIAGPAAMAISAIVVGLRGDVLRIAIIQVINLYIMFVLF
jgi:auxin efflux carrier family